MSYENYEHNVLVFSSCCSILVVWRNLVTPLEWHDSNTWVWLQNITETREYKSNKWQCFNKFVFLLTITSLLWKKKQFSKTVQNKKFTQNYDFSITWCHDTIKYKNILKQYWHNLKHPYYVQMHTGTPYSRYFEFDYWIDIDTQRLVRKCINSYFAQLLNYKSHVMYTSL